MQSLVSQCTETYSELTINAMLARNRLTEKKAAMSRRISVMIASVLLIVLLCSIFVLIASRFIAGEDGPKRTEMLEFRASI
ncbi:hypothetical protein V6767_00540 [Martelella sp. FLE1502]